MQKYIIPSLTGLVTHDYLSYEGIRKTPELYAVLEGNQKYNQSPKVLHDYQNDLYMIILKKLSQFIEDSSVNDSEALKIQGLMQELIKVKKMIAEIDNKKL